MPVGILIGYAPPTIDLQQCSNIDAEGEYATVACTKFLHIAPQRTNSIVSHSLFGFERAINALKLSLFLRYAYSGLGRTLRISEISVISVHTSLILDHNLLSKRERKRLSTEQFLCHVFLSVFLLVSTLENRRVLCCNVHLVE